MGGREGGFSSTPINFSVGRAWKHHLLERLVMPCQHTETFNGGGCLGNKEGIIREQNTSHPEMNGIWRLICPLLASAHGYTHIHTHTRTSLRS